MTENDKQWEAVAVWGGVTFVLVITAVVLDAVDLPNWAELLVGGSLLLTWAAIPVVSMWRANARENKNGQNKTKT